jgi:hypothetical protein
MKLISVMSRGDRLVKVWQRDFCRSTAARRKKPFSIYKGKIRKSATKYNFFGFAGEAHFYNAENAIKAAEKWLKDAKG